jgi:hypothetical protein
MLLDRIKAQRAKKELGQVYKKNKGKEKEVVL